jgi:hypothetical protein
MNLKYKKQTWFNQADSFHKQITKTKKCPSWLGEMSWVLHLPSWVLQLPFWLYSHFGTCKTWAANSIHFIKLKKTIFLL